MVKALKAMGAGYSARLLGSCFLELVALPQPPSLSAMARHASRRLSATARSTTDRATTMPPTHKAAIA